MTNTQQIEKHACHIADAIVELVERTDGPVTLARIHREVPGFAKEDPDVWKYVIEGNDGDTIIWTDMTEAGLIGLCKAISARRIAVQRLASPLLYIIEGFYYPQVENWTPVVLLPARAANLDTPNWRMRSSAAFQKHCMDSGVQGYRLLTPGHVRYTADQFSI
jgi:hypothetical protein